RAGTRPQPLARRILHRGRLPHAALRHDRRRPHRRTPPPHPPMNDRIPAGLCAILCFLCFLLGAVFGVGLLFHEAATRGGNPELADP
ncbi:MAG: hypothetical protein ACK5S6_01885, partial [bacterium]